MVKIILNN